MKKFLTDFQRQTEILAKCLNGERFSKADYADIYKVTEITISRDLKALRDYGIQIFSRKNKIEILESPSKENLISISSNYLPLKLNQDLLKNQTKAILRSGSNKNFPLLILTAKAVNESRIIKFSYKRLSDDQKNSYIIKPVRLIANQLNWILHGFKENENIIKSFYLKQNK